MRSDKRQNVTRPLKAMGLGHRQVLIALRVSDRCSAVKEKGKLKGLWLIPLNIKKPNNPIEQWAESLKSHIPTVDIQMARRHMRRCSASLTTREIQIRTTVNYHLTPVRMTITKKTTNKKCW